MCLNELLYDALGARFGNVAVANEGEGRIVCYRPDWDDPSRQEAEVIYAGEYYRVNCPWCYDTRQRLWINHDWGVWDERSGDDNLHLVHCFNAECVKTRQRQVELQHMLLVPARMMPRSRRVPLYQAPPQQVFTLPQNCVPINQLPPYHAASTYLVERGFDLNDLRERWQVSFCEYDGESKPQIHNRIIVPVYRPAYMLGSAPNECRATALAGWQARVLGTAEPSVPKYLCCQGMAKSRLLYGMPQAMGTKAPVIVCEGPTDVWRLQGNAVALFGKSMSCFQKEKLAQHFINRPIVIMLDSDAQAEARRIMWELAQARATQPGSDRRVVIGTLPEGGKDPADFTCEQVMAAAEQALCRQQ